MFDGAVSECIRCGECLPACPARLSPLRLFLLWQDGEIEKMAAEESLDECILCGRCDLACPSLLPLSDSFAAARKEINEIRTRRRTAEGLRRRNVSHLQRLSAPRPAAKLNPATLAAEARAKVQAQLQSESEAAG